MQYIHYIIFILNKLMLNQQGRIQFIKSDSKGIYNIIKH